MALPTFQEEFSGISFDLGSETMVGDGGKRLWAAANDGRRGLEILLILARAHLADEAMNILALRRRMTDPPGVDQVRRLLRAIEERGLVRYDLDEDDITLNINADAKIGPGAYQLQRGLERIQLLIRGERGMNLGPKDRSLVLIAQAEGDIAQGRSDQVLDTLLKRPDRTSTLKWIERNTGGSNRAMLSLALNTLLAEASMNVADVPSALAHIERGRRWATNLDHADEWLLRLAGTEAATLRIHAALHPGSQRDILERCIDRFRAGDAQATSARHLPGEQQQSRRCWLLAESSTPLCLSGELSSAFDNLARAESLLGGLADNGTNANTALLLRSRVELACGDWRAADRLIDGAKAAIREQGSPQWLRGWVQRHSADIIWTSGAGAEDIRKTLRIAWVANAGFEFQQLQILVRFALWNVEPVSPKSDALGDKDKEILRQMSRLIVQWHCRLRELPPSRCSHCKGTPNERVGALLTRRIRCTFCLGTVLRSREHQALGVWR
jgi:hypothetical protein